jgi:predicted nucleotidyltransferase
VKKEHQIIKDVLLKDGQIEFAYLFGSRVTGRIAAGSDWDIAIFYRDDRKFSRWDRFYLEGDLSRVLGAEVQITILNDVSSPLFFFEIISKGELLIDRNPELRLIFETKRAAAYHDWQHFQNRRAAGSSS